jgi:hypothetical protein
MSYHNVLYGTVSKDRILKKIFLYPISILGLLDVLYETVC